jgi:3-hydroxyacyl-CoA dehydrogenase
MIVQSNAAVQSDLPQPFASRTVGIIGAGLMGTAIAAATAKCGIRVVLCDVDPQVLDTVPARIACEADAAAAGRVTTTSDLPSVANCDVVLESIVESLAAKQRLYSELEPHLGAGTKVFSNTSTIPIAALTAKMRDGSRFCGLHFFHPVRRRPLVEIIRGPATSDRTVATAAALAEAIGKVPLVANDGPGFLVNRLLVPYLGEALELLLEGAAIESIERAVLDFGMAMGPLRLADEIGLDTLLLGGRVLWQAFPERIAPSPLLVTMCKAKRLGRKVGRGFFAYPAGIAVDEPGCLDPQVEPILAAWAKGRQSFTASQIIDRLLLPMTLEATRMLDEKAVGQPCDIDQGTVLGLGFPAARGGLLRWADERGPREIVAALGQFGHLGTRVKPTSLLLDMARSGARFYA